MTAAARPSGAPLPSAFVARLTELFGDRANFTAAVRDQHGASESYYPTIRPDAVVFPCDTQDVVALVRLCGAHAVPLIPFGAGTCMEGQTTPIAGGVCIDMTRMNRILTVNNADFDCTVEAGVRRHQLNHHLRDHGLFFPIDPGADATIGGMASTRASGTNAVRYGTMRDAVLALRVVTPAGDDLRTGRRVRKSAAGYDLTRLFVGAEGTLGIITEVTLRLHPIPEAILAATCAFDTLKGAVDTVVTAIQYGVPLARVELLDDVQMRAVNQRSALGAPEQPTLFFEFHGSERHVAEQVELVGEIAGTNGGSAFRWARQAEDRNRLWRARHEALYAAVGLRPGCVGWSTDVCVPISRLAECILETRRELDESPLPAPIVGHVGDGNFHVIFVIDPNKPEEFAEAERLNRHLVQRALDMDGSCTGEHGIGIGKQDWLEQELGAGVDLMRTIKAAIDPAHIFNPGKIFSLPR